MAPFVFGDLPTYCKFGLEQSCAGSARFFDGGAAKVICFDFTNLGSALKVGDDQCMHTAMKSVSAETAEAVLGKVKCWNGTVGASGGQPKAFVVPPGLYVCMCPVNGNIAGVRMPFWSSGSFSTSSTEKIKECNIDGFGKAAICPRRTRALARTSPLQRPLQKVAKASPPTEAPPAKRKKAKE